MKTLNEFINENVEIIQNDPDPKWSVEISQKEEKMLQDFTRIVKAKKIYLDSTIHGKIATFEKSFSQQRYDVSELAKMSKFNFRWIQFFGSDTVKGDHILVGF